MILDPLARLTLWLNVLPPAIKNELIFLSGQFHPLPEINSIIGSEQVKLFMDYIDSTSIGNKEIVIRTLIVTKLIDHALSGRDTNEGWTEALDRTLALAAKFQKDGASSDMIDEFMNTFEERKNTWINIGKSWTEFKESQISDKQLSEWHFIKTFEKK